MAVTLAGKKYKLRDLSTLRWRIKASKLSDDFGTAFKNYLTLITESFDNPIAEEAVASAEKKAEEVFAEWCNMIFVPKWYSFLGIKTFRASLLDIPEQEVKDLRETFFSIVNPQQESKQS